MEIYPDDNIIVIPCHHLYHYGCLYNYFETISSKCPVCKINPVPLSNTINETRESEEIVPFDSIYNLDQKQNWDDYEHSEGYNSELEIIEEDDSPKSIVKTTVFEIFKGLGDIPRA
ncbi:hypothetical protein BB558_003008 [Smittium angustum]|nr:hypothetical protein BB558_003008 [Smittium angustum]